MIVTKWPAWGLGAGCAGNILRNTTWGFEGDPNPGEGRGDGHALRVTAGPADQEFRRALWAGHEDGVRIFGPVSGSGADLLGGAGRVTESGLDAYSKSEGVAGWPFDVDAKCRGGIRSLPEGGGRAVLADSQVGATIAVEVTHSGTALFAQGEDTRDSSRHG